MTDRYDLRNKAGHPETCTRCIMSVAADPKISFDAHGICNHCQRYDALLPMRVLTGQAGENALDRLVYAIKKHGIGKEYDCLIGISGGVDSTYVAWLVKQLGLRPLAVHVDNGWNSELSVKNIELTLRKLNIDLYTEVLDWEEFRDLQLSFIKASTPDLEIPTDHALIAVLWQQAQKHGIKHIISGMNFATESTFVQDWAYGHWDWRYIKGIQNKFGTAPLKTFPHYTVANLAWWNLRGIRSISVLNYVDYHKPNAMEFLKQELGWQYYGGKHYESIYTRFIQGYILPVKFGIDKRYGHLSDLIRSGQITRDEALIEIKNPAYPEELFTQDYHFVLKKFGLSDNEFQAFMQRPPRTFRDYANAQNVMLGMRKTLGWLRKLGFYPK